MKREKEGVLEMWFDVCPWGLFGLVVDLVFFVIGIIVVVMITKWANKRGWVGEKYCLVLLAAVVLATFACINYDVRALKCNCDAPIAKSSDAK